MTQHRADLSDSGRQVPRDGHVRGRRVADRPVDSVATTSRYVGRRVAIQLEPDIVPELRLRDDLRTTVSRRVAELAAQAEQAAAVEAVTTPEPVTVEPVTVEPVTVEPVAAEPVESLADSSLTDSAVQRAIVDLEPADATTSFSDDATERLPLVRAGGKRRATPRRRNPLLRVLPSPALGAGLAALALAVAGTVGTDDLGLSGDGGRISVASALNGNSGTGAVGGRDEPPISRDSAGDALEAAGGGLAQAVTAAAAERAGVLKDLRNKAQQEAQRLADNRWRKPLESYRISATFGATGLWSSHSGLDLAAPSGTPIYAIANGVITETGYQGNCGNTTVLTLENGTELRFCHQSDIEVEPGTEVFAGDLIGYVGSTGRSTGPHLHLEVRPGGGDPVDPYAALQANGVTL